MGLVVKRHSLGELLSGYPDVVSALSSPDFNHFFYGALISSALPLF